MESYDVMVIGAGLAGTCAALQASRCGCRVLLVEKNALCGGTAVLSDIAFPGLFNAWGKQIIRGIGWELVSKTLELMGEDMPDMTDSEMSNHPRFQVHLNCLLFAGICEEELAKAGVTFRYHTMIASVREEEDWVCVAVCGKEGLSELRCRILIDCTGDGNAIALAGGELLGGDECQPASFSVRLSGYNLDQLDVPALEKAFHKAAEAGEILGTDLSWCNAFGLQILDKHGNNGNHIVCTRAWDSRNKTALELEAHRSVLRMYRFLRKQPGLESLQMELSAMECGVRETKRMRGEWIITSADYISGRSYPDGLCYSYYPIDMHNTYSGVSKNYGQSGCFPSVPRRALQACGFQRLLGAGRLVSSDREANSALRVQCSCMSTGQAAGAIAAAACCQKVSAVHASLEMIQDVLRKHDAVVPPDTPPAFL